MLDIDTAENALLSLSLPDHPGWAAQLDGEPVRILRAYAGLSAVEIPAGQHVLRLRFSPTSYRIGAIISALAWLALALVALRKLLRR